MKCYRAYHSVTVHQFRNDAPKIKIFKYIFKAEFYIQSCKKESFQRTLCSRVTI